MLFIPLFVKTDTRHLVCRPTHLPAAMAHSGTLAPNLGAFGSGGCQWEFSSWIVVSLVRAVLIRSSNSWDEVYFLVLLMIFNSTSAAFLFWYLLWFACILTFSFELRVDVASLELTFGCFDCFLRRLFPLLCLPFRVFFSFLPRFQYRNWNLCDKDRCPRTSVPPKKMIYHRANQSTPAKSWNLAPNRKNLSR